ncbi:MAG: type III polyketide synthase [Candidatus Wallbacteria bacterium]|nr:type III polyketide synthase [Candidatus Wallbacteria bacterium]
MTATIVAAASAFPETVVGKDEVVASLRKVFGGRVRDLETYCAMVDHSGIERRHLALPVEELVRPRPFGQRNSDYARLSRGLAEEAAGACLTRAGVAASDVDLLITLSCTGFTIPAIDAHLINRMGFRRDVDRLPVTEMGCAAGAWSLGRARERALAVGGGLTLVVSVELPGLTFQPGDVAPANLVSSVLFGDGAAAVLADGRSGKRGFRVLDSRSVLFPESTGLMGFDLDEDGFHIVLDRKIPFVIAREALPRMREFLAGHDLRPQDAGFWVVHPGGKRILDAIAAALELGPRELGPTLAVWSERGNLSSATVLAVLEKLFENPPAAGSRGLAIAFGPGFCMEMVLLEWVE